MNILVTGGAGYIGCHAVKELLAKGYWPIIYDNLSEGHREAALGGEFVEADLSDEVKLSETFEKYPIDAVLHFAAFCLVGESVEDPQKYYHNNVANGLKQGLSTGQEIQCNSINPLKVFGADYPTPDGTCIRDYIHVTDLAHAHILALEALSDGMESKVFNLGNGNGYSVREVIEAARKVTGREIPVVEAERRQGDPAILVASSEKIKRELGWKPRFPELEQIIESAWKWHKDNPNGFQ